MSTASGSRPIERRMPPGRPSPRPHPRSRYIPIEVGLAELRLLKSPAEIEAIGRACALGDEAFAHLCAAVRPGMTERGVARLDRRRSSRTTARRTSPSTASSSSEPGPRCRTARPVDTQVAEGQPLLLDFGCQVDGYRSDMTRTVFVGEPSAEARHRHELVAQAQEAALEAVAVGVRRHPLRTRRPGPRLADAGYPGAFSHGVGHGIGLDVHEPPGPEDVQQRRSRPAWCSASSRASTCPATSGSGSRTSSPWRTAGPRLPDPTRRGVRWSSVRASGRVISTGEIRKGIVIELDGQPVRVLDWSHIKMARGSAQVRLKIQNVRSGAITERTFQAGTRWPRARVEQRKVQYLYSDGDSYHFMDAETYDQFAISGAQLGTTRAT